PEYERIIGGSYPEERGKEGVVSAALGYKHGVEFDVQTAVRHPVTLGLKDFKLLDEIYWGFRTSREVTPLLTTSHPKSGNPIGWAHKYKRSRVVVIQPGHGPGVF